MTTDKATISAMHQRFHAVRDQAAPLDAGPSGPWFEAELVAILRRPVPPGMAREGHAAKEREIGELFARLTVMDARALHHRLVCKPAGDPLVDAFARLVDDRRARLLAFLGDARRRAVLGCHAR